MKHENSTGNTFCASTFNRKFLVSDSKSSAFSVPVKQCDQPVKRLLLTDSEITKSNLLQVTPHCILTHPMSFEVRKVFDKNDTII